MVPRGRRHVVALVLLLAGCSSVDDAATSSGARNGTVATTLTTVPGPALTLPPAPPFRSGPVEPAVAEVLPLVVSSLRNGALDARVVAAVGASRDGRLGWILSDLMRLSGGDDEKALATAFSQVTGAGLQDASSDGNAWQVATDLLIAWDTPAPDGYQSFKAELFLALEPRWRPIFEDASADIDWRFLSWGGVLIDDRPLGDTDACIRGCIPALDDPPLTSAADGDWYPDDRLVFGITLGGEAVALPKNMMEVHEMVNLTIAGRRVAVPYCTLCGSAEAFFTDRVKGAERALVVRTSGLLYLSNKVMYDLDSSSAFDTFNGRAVSGPLHRAGTTLPMLTVVTSTWGRWRAEHPTTRIIARDGGLGRDYELDPLGGRDANGPIFPIRRADTRLPVHTQVLGVVAADGTAVAFPVDAARAAIQAGRSVKMRGVMVVADGGGLRATVADADVATHQAFWFAWAQFHAGTELWQETSAPS